MVWPSLAVKGRNVTAGTGEVMAVESVNRPDSTEEPFPIPIADVRAVPLGQLCEDADALRMVNRAMMATEGSACVRVAMFQSAI